jgi:hypothetical protein
MHRLHIQMRAKQKPRCDRHGAQLSRACLIGCAGLSFGHSLHCERLNGKF